MHYRAAKVNKECIEATNAVFTGKPLPVIRREGLEAIDALAQLVGVKVHVMLHLILNNLDVHIHKNKIEWFKYFIGNGKSMLKSIRMMFLQN